MTYRPKKPKPKALWTRVKGTSYRPVVKKSRRIRPRTTKRALEEARYRTRVKAWLAGKECAMCPKNSRPAAPATECHHYRGRIKGLLLMEKFWIPLCRECHKWTHDFPLFARRTGWLAPAGEWNTIPKGEV